MRITPAPVELDYPTLLADTSDVNLLAYSLETVIAEKFQTLIDRGTANSRMKDFYDLYTILEQDRYDPILLKESVTATFVNRNTNYQEDNQFFSIEFGNNEGLKMRWQAFMKKLNAPVKPSFGEVVAYIQRQLGGYWENLKY